MIFVRSTLTRTQREDEQQILSMLRHDHIYNMKNHFKMSLIMNEKRCAQKQNKLYKEFSGNSINPT